MDPPIINVIELYPFIPKDSISFENSIEEKDLPSIVKAII